MPGSATPDPGTRQRSAGGGEARPTGPGRAVGRWVVNECTVSVSLQAWPGRFENRMRGRERMRTAGVWLTGGVVWA